MYTRNGGALSRNPLGQSRDPRPPTEKRLRVWGKLRKYEKRDKHIRRRDTVSIRRYITRQLKGELYLVVPATLTDIHSVKPRQAMLLALLMLACYGQKASALVAKYEEFAEFLHCSKSTAYRDIHALEAAGFIAIEPRFRTGKFTGRDGRELGHKQEANWYRPGKRLWSVWLMVSHKRKRCPYTRRQLPPTPTKSVDNSSASGTPAKIMDRQTNDPSLRDSAGKKESKNVTHSVPKQRTEVNSVESQGQTPSSLSTVLDRLWKNDPDSAQRLSRLIVESSVAEGIGRPAARPPRKRPCAARRAFSRIVEGP